MVSNRVSTARHADEILVLDEGKQVAFGTHEVLMTQQGLYRDLANAQQMTEEGPQ
jgi:ATP-binding cassette subfamily B protein